MAVPGYLWQEIDLNGTAKQDLPTLVIPPNNGIRAHAMLTKAVANAPGGGADCWISKYRQAGVWHNGPVRLISGQGITDIAFGMQVWNCNASATVLVELF
jgi:hypothetical protein